MACYNLCYADLFPAKGGITMNIELTEKQFRRLLDLVYVGNWVMNSTRGDDRIREYDDVERL